MSCRLLVRSLLVQFFVSSLATGGPATPVSTRAALKFGVGGDDELAVKLREPLSSILREKARLDFSPSNRAESVDLELTCRVRRSGYRIDAVIVAARTRAVVARRSKVGDPEEIFDLIDELGRSVADAVDTGGKYGTVAVLDFVNEAGEDGGTLTGAMPEVLMTALRQSSELTLLDMEEVGANRTATEPVMSSRMSIADAAELVRC